MLPLPTEVLPLPPEVVDEEDGHGWLTLHRSSGQAILDYLIDELDAPDELATTIASLANRVGLDEHDCRAGLLVLLHGGDFRLIDRDAVDIDPDAARLVEPLRLVIDWERFNEERIEIVLM